ncbi:MaoC family dehydratase [Nesterenkonia sp. CL21]|uniref:MaoC family dehydratase n=1 Tax=Nesterenkonia sp. CL21 TaxID=3064894 RepID=UPI0028792820|nr:MaoC family dehydratase [Nesterenkonia sp. CL21]MDS2174015.1 MaoC family dehydratase [Nesterenkonia sp. CL21]
MSEQRIIQQRGLYLDEIEVGAVYRHAPGRTVTEADNVGFTTLTMNTQSLHLDAHWAAQQPFGRPLVNSMFTLSTLVGASVAQLTQGTIVANLGFEAVSFPHPLFHGDTLYSESEILDTRPSGSRPGQGIARIRHRGRNQEGTVVAECVRSVMLWVSEEAHRSGTAEGTSGGSA